MSSGYGVPLIRFATLLAALPLGGCPQRLDDDFTKSSVPAPSGGVTHSGGQSTSSLPGAGTAGAGSDERGGSPDASAGVPGTHVGGGSPSSSGGAEATGGAPATGGSGASEEPGGTAGTSESTVTGGAAGTAGTSESTVTGGAAGTHEATGGTAGNGPPCELGDFPEPEVVDIPGVSGNLWGSTLSASASTLYFSANIDSWNGIYRATRFLRDTEFSAAEPVNFVDFEEDARTPFLSVDGQRLYFTATSVEGDAGHDLVVAERLQDDTTFGTPMPLGGVNGNADDRRAWLTDDELRIVFVSARYAGEGELDLWEAVRSSLESEFETPENVPGINTEYNDDSPTLSPDGLTLYFVSDRPDTDSLGGKDIYVASRNDLDSEFDTPTNLTVLNSSETEADLALTRDGRELFFSTVRSGSAEIWRSVRDCR